MNKVAKLDAGNRADLFRETGNRMNLPAALVEKDFWVCWVLRQVFAIDSLRGRVLFKGGTSLSKVFRAIRRFSEDIDLAIDFEMLGFTAERHPDAAASRSALEKLLARMLAACRTYVEGDFLKALKQQLAEVLGPGSDWELRTRPSDEHSVVVEFAYPPCLGPAEAVGYVRPMVVLEPGTHAELIPRGRYAITPFAAEQFPQAFGEPACEVEAITGERTFWEKATILHAEHHRPTGKPSPLRHSRHYYDVAMLAAGPLRGSALGDRELLERVVRHKTRFYPSAWARYDLAIPGTFRLVPPPGRLADLRRDYEAMRVMIFGESPVFDDILAALQMLEDEINHLPARRD